MPENRRFLPAYVRTRDVRTVLTLVLPPAAQKTASFRDCPSQLGWDACITCHAMHRTNTTLVGSECTDVHRGSTRLGGVADAEAAVEPAPKRRSTSLHSSSRPSKRSRRDPDHDRGLLILRRLRRGIRGLDLDPHVRSRGPRRPHCGLGHRHQSRCVGLHVALLRLP